MSFGHRKQDGSFPQMNDIVFLGPLAGRRPPAAVVSSAEMLILDVCASPVPIAREIEGKLLIVKYLVNFQKQ